MKQKFILPATNGWDGSHIVVDSEYIPPIEYNFYPKSKIKTALG